MLNLNKNYNKKLTVKVINLLSCFLFTFVIVIIKLIYELYFTSTSDIFKSC